MQRGNSAKRLVETWHPLIQDMQKVGRPFTPFPACVLKSVRKDLLSSSPAPLYYCANDLSVQLLVYLLSKIANNPTSEIWIGFRSIDSGEFHWTDGQPRKYVRNVLLVSV